MHFSTFSSMFLTNYLGKHITYDEWSILNHIQSLLTVILGINIFEVHTTMGQWFGIPLLILGLLLEDYYQVRGGLRGETMVGLVFSTVEAEGEASG